MRWKDAEILKKDLGGGCIRRKDIFFPKRKRNEMRESSERTSVNGKNGRIQLPGSKEKMCQNGEHKLQRRGSIPDTDLSGESGHQNSPAVISQFH